MAIDPGIKLRVTRGGSPLKEPDSEEVTQSITFATATTAEQEGDTNETE